MKRLVLIAAVLAVPVAVQAQNDFGAWVNSTQFHSTSLTDITAGATVKVKFDRKLGYGISFNHFSGPNVSTEFAAHQLRSDVKATLHSTVPPIDQSARLGSFKVNQLSAIMKWHFLPRWILTPYVGAGVAYFTGGQIKTVNDPTIGETAQTFRLDKKYGFVGNAGVNFAATRSILIGLDAKYAPYKAVEQGRTNPADDVKLNPLTIALGVRFRM